MLRGGRCLLTLTLTVVCILFAWGSPLESDDFSSPFGKQILRYAKSAEIHNMMDESVEPCEDFYAFACGHWDRINPANSMERMTTGFFETVQEAFNRKVGIVLAEDDDGKDTAIDKKVKNFYESCINFSAIKHFYKSKLLETIEEFGQMPAIEGPRWKANEFDWLETVAEMANKYAITIIIGYDIMSDFADNSVNRVYIGHPDLPLESRSMYLDEGNAEYRTQYQESIANNLKNFLGLSKDLAQRTAQEILQFEVSLAKGIVDDKAGLQLQEMATLTTIDDMQSKYAPELNIQRFINISLGTVPTEPVYEMIEDYQRNLVELMRKTPKRTVANYIFYTFVENFFLKLPKKKSELKSKCIDNTKKYFAKNLDNMVYRKYNTNDTEKGVEFMWREIQSTFESVLESPKLEWIGKTSRSYAVEKLWAMKLEVNSYEKEDFNKEFDALIMGKHDYVVNLKAIMRLNAQNSRKKLNEPPAALDAGELLSFTPANIIVENKIKVPVSMLQPYYVWSSTYPNAVKYGTLGALISHELIHGFDDMGRNFDKDGNNRNWWDEKSSAAFVNRTRCFVDQYKKYTYNDQLLPEMNSQSENIADNGGVRLAYEAYLRWYESAFRANENMEDEKLPRLAYTGKQLFFISYAQIWCNDIHPALRNLQTSTDTHVPGKFRVIGPLSNFDEFAKEFNCAKGTKMNPDQQCSIY
ncbi:membrane metallo-endopeptidase-like 1 [Stomoxys calcitrans]|uniref:Peptidase M13 C-terminal domain-containing protein n=1 Tax=Stomoxys calcitrans TaxID=35570 RepID=A0A1I8P4P2_STOCA|nr:membrane metallo-endopeptidase-like 1 [Stomoxys calcitrans]